MNIKLLYYLITINYNSYKINSTDNLLNYLLNLDNLIISKRKELGYLNARKISNIELTSVIKTLQSKYNTINNIISSFKNNILTNIDKLNILKLNINIDYSDELKKRIHNYITHNILYYNSLLNSELIWHDFVIHEYNYNINDILDKFNNYISINNNILCIINYDLYKCNYLDYILLEYLNINKWDLSNITNQNISIYINNKINIDLNIDKIIHINYIIEKIKIILTNIKTNIINYHNSNINEIILYLSTIYNYIILDFNVNYWNIFIKNIINKNENKEIDKIMNSINNNKTTKSKSSNIKYNTNKIESTQNNIHKIESTKHNIHKIEQTKNNIDVIESITDNIVKIESINDNIDEIDKIESINDNIDKIESINDNIDEIESINDNIDEVESIHDNIDDSSLILPKEIIKPIKINKKNTIYFSIKNDNVWLCLEWPDVDNELINKIHINYNNEISKQEIDINGLKFKNLIIYLYLKKVKYIKEFLDEYDIDINNYIKNIFDINNNYVKPDKIIELLGLNLDKYIIKQIEKNKTLDIFNELLRDWNIDKISIIRKGLYNKYIQNKTLRIALLNTGNKYLIDLDDNTGANIIGIITMQIRYIISKQ